jgi:hypothetical protein
MKKDVTNFPRPTMINKDGTIQTVFSNIVNIFANPREIFIDFGIVSPKDSSKNDDEVVLQSRVVMTIDHAQELLNVLENIIADTKK